MTMIDEFGDTITPIIKSTLKDEVMSMLPTIEDIHFAMWLLNVVYNWSPKKVSKMSKGSLEKWVRYAKNRLKVEDILALHAYKEKSKESLWEKIKKITG